MNFITRVKRSRRFRLMCESYYRTFCKKPKVFTVRYNDVVGPYRLCMSLSDGPGTRQRLHTGTEMEERRIFLPLLQKGWVGADVGARFGDYAIEMALMIGPQGKVYAYEAIPHCYDLLLKSVAANNLANVECRLAVAGDAAGTLEVPSAMLTGNLSVPGRFVAGEEKNMARVPILPLDDDIKHLDTVKIDVEGYELRVLNGMKRLLAENPALLVYLEVHNRQLLEIGDSLEGLAHLLLDEFQLQIRQISFKHCLCFRSGFDLQQYPLITSVPQFVEAYKGT